MNGEADYTTIEDPANNKEFRLISWGSPYGMATHCTLAVEEDRPSMAQEGYFLVTSMTGEGHNVLGVADFAGYPGGGYVSHTRSEELNSGQALGGPETMLNFMQASREHHKNYTKNTGLTMGVGSNMLQAILRHSMSYEASIAHSGAAMDFESPNSLSHRLGSAILSQLQRECQNGDERVATVGAHGIVAGFIVEDQDGILLAERNRTHVTISRMRPPFASETHTFAEQYRIGPDVTIAEIAPITLNDEERRDFGPQVAMNYFIHGTQEYLNRPASDDPAPADALQTDALNKMLMQILSDRMGLSNVSSRPK